MPIRLLKILVVPAFFAGVLAQAAPPVDLSDYGGNQRVVKKAEKPLTDRDLIFTDNIIKPEKLLHGLVLFKKPTLGRAEAKADARALLRFKPEYRARFLKFSKDKKWVAVELLNGRKRAWVSADAIEILDEDYTKQAPAPKE
jgi:hypothetical protein